jgi:hypothetical protein
MDDDETDDPTRKPILTLGDLLDSDIVGMLADLDDDRDSTEIARELRDHASRRFGR